MTNDQRTRRTQGLKNPRRSAAGELAHTHWLRWARATGNSLVIAYRTAVLCRRSRRRQAALIASADSGQQALLRLAVLDDGDRAVAGGHQELVRVDAELRVNRRRQVGHGERVALGFAASRVRGAVHVTFLDPATGKHDAEDFRVMV